MLKLPEKGFSNSAKVHNCDLAVVCDWIEISLIACDEEVSRSSISDILVEQQIYHKDRFTGLSFCSEFLDSVWTEMRRRERLAGSTCLFSVSGKRISRKTEWIVCPTVAFLLVLCSIEYYNELRTGNFKNKYITQGDLFEDFCKESICLGGWKVARTGWSSNKNSPKKLVSTVNEAAKALQELDVRDQMVKLHSGKNEAGCDLVACKPYEDGRTGRPIALIQCASGANFQDKLGTPSIDLWRKFITFSTIPLRGFCTPRAFNDEDFNKFASQVDGVFIDRHRLLSPFASSGELSQPLTDSIKEWLRPRIQSLPVLK